jgi:hypothetical protein
MANLFGKEEVYLKIVLRKTEHHKSNNRQHGQKGGASHGNNFQQTLEDKKLNSTVGLVLCKAEILDENPTKSRKKQPRQNKLGEVSIDVSFVLLSLILFLLYIVGNSIERIIVEEKEKLF